MHASVRPALSVNLPPIVTSAAARETPEALAMRMTISKLDFFYGAKQTLFDVSMGIATNKVTSLIGPSGCGKSTLLRTLNRMHETVRGAQLRGEILLDGQSILAQDVTALRRRVGMVFQRPNPFPKSMFDNVAYGLRINGSQAPISEAVEKSLRHAALWDEVKDHLHKSAYELSGGQQQRLCIARALAVEPEVLLLDEPCSALDPISTAKIEELLVQLKDICTITIVTHNMQQAARVSDFTAFLLTGQLIEFSPTPQLFTTPGNPPTEAYITGRIGDQAVNIAQGALRVLRHPRVKPYVDLPRMSELVEEMVRNALNAVVRRDVELAQSVLATDDQVDHYRDQIFRELLTYMMGDSSVVFPAFELILVAKNLERIGDHATNIAEDVIYLVQGQDIRHNTVDRR